MIDFINISVDKMADVNEYIYFVDDILDPSTGISILEKSDVLGDSFEFPALNLNTTFTSSEDNKEFESFLINQYISNEKKSMKYIRKRKDIMRHFKRYFVLNSENLSDYVDIEPRTKEFNNICYFLYRGITHIYPEYAKKKHKFRVDSVIKTPLLYKVSVRLPEYIDVKTLRIKDNILEEHLMSKEGNRDYEVHVCIDKVQNNIVFTLLRFDLENRISIGDILNFGTGFTYQLLRDSEFELPTLVGLIDNEYPLLAELEGNGTVAIVGSDTNVSLSHSLAMNLAMTAHYDDIQFVIASSYDSSVWNMFSRMPHVLGYHTKMDNIPYVIEDVHKVAMERLKIARRNKVTSFKELKPLLGNHHAQMYLVVEGATNLFRYYKTYVNDRGITYIGMMDKLNEIAEFCDITGVSIMFISKRGDETNLPLKVREHAEMRVGLADGSENDYFALFGRDVKETGRSTGEDNNIISYDSSSIETEYIHTPVTGGLNKEQTLSLIRVVAFEWVRKSLYDLSIVHPPEGLNMPFAYNRDEIASDTLEKIRDGKVLPKW